MNSVQILNTRELTRAMEWVYKKQITAAAREWADSLMQHAYAIDGAPVKAKPNLTLVRADD